MEDIVFRFEQDALGIGAQIVAAMQKAIAEALGHGAQPLTMADLGQSFEGRRLLFELPPSARPADADGPRLVTNAQGWIRKTILYTGTWPAGPLGTAEDEQFEITLADLEQIKRAFDEGAYERVPVPWGHGPIGEDMEHATRFNTGWVRGLEILLDERRPGEYILDAWIEFTDQEALAKIQAGSVWNVSVMLAWDVQRPSDGTVFPLALRHVALTNFPWVEGMAGFARQGSPRNEAEGDGPPEDDQNEEDKMGTVADKQDAVSLAEFQEMQAQMARMKEQADKQAEVFAAREAKLAETEKALAARAAELDREKQVVRVREVVMALEGGAPVAGLSLPEGYRHYPAVVSAVEAILGKDGKAEAVLVQLLNALPEAALQKIETQPTAPRDEANEPDPLVLDSPEAVEAYMKDMGI